MYQYCQSNMEKGAVMKGKCNHNRRTFFLSKDIIHNRPDREATTTVKGARTFHSVKGISPGLVGVRALSFVDEWSLKRLNLKSVLAYKDQNKTAVKDRNRKSAVKDQNKKSAVKDQNRKSAAKEKKQPAAKEKKQPTVKEKKQPAVKEKKQPAAKEKKQPMVQEKKQPAVKDQEQPAAKDQEQPAVKEKKQRIMFFRNTLSRLQTSSSFDELQRMCLKLTEDPYFQKCRIHMDDKITMVQSKLAADSLALNIMPENDRFSNRMPVRITGDGNCLPRSASVACFRNEEHHKEIRVRIVTAMCLGEELYTNNDNLHQSLEFPRGEGDHLSSTYTMMSQMYTVGDRITPSVTKRIFRAEAMVVVKDKEFMGIWQLFALADVLGTTVISVYPDLGGPVPRAVLGRKINPVVVQQRKPLFIMWTSTREDMGDQHWIPNHFVPLIQVCVPLVEFIDDSDEDVDLDDSLIDTLLRTVAEITDDEAAQPCEALDDGLVPDDPVSSQPSNDRDDNPAAAHPSKALDDGMVLDDDPRPVGAQPSKALHDGMFLDDTVAAQPSKALDDGMVIDDDPRPVGAQPSEALNDDPVAAQPSKALDDGMVLDDTVAALMVSVFNSRFVQA